MYHLRLSGEHYQMGVKRGKIFKKANVYFPLLLDDFQLNHGIESEKILRKNFPEVCEEIRGVSDTLGEDYFKFASWLLCMGCCMHNLDINFPIEIRGCTAFAFSKNGRIIYGRNNDLPPYLKNGCKSEIYSPKNGYRFNITTSSFINGEEGMNEHGLAAAMTFVMTKPEDIRAGFNSCFIVRYLLEKANTTEKAMTMLMNLPTASNCNILIADKSGKMVVVECTPDFKKIRGPEIIDSNKVICTVNSFTSTEMKSHNVFDCGDYNSFLRYETVLNSFKNHMHEDVIEDTKQLLKGNYGFMCQYDNEPDFETVWSSIFDLNSLDIYRAEGDPRKKNFIMDMRLHDILK